jgi:hypothetical protein
MHAPSMPPPPTPPALPAPRSRSSALPDGCGAGDHDTPFAGFGAAQFSTRQWLHLLLRRSEAEALHARLGLGRWVQDLGAA